ncbi:MAG: hypothetical protein Kow0099_32190 [Candidatus Abyssubacteria bacterium]
MASWNTYDPLGMNRIVRFPELYEVRISVFAPQHGAYASKFYFLEHMGDAGNVLRADCHSTDCSYASVTLSFAGCILKVEYAADADGALSCCVEPIAVADPFTLVLVELCRAWELAGEVCFDGNSLSFAGDAGGNVRISAMQHNSSVYNPGAPVSAGVYASEEEFLHDLTRSGKLNGRTGKGGFAGLAFIARIPLRFAARTEGPTIVLSGINPAEVEHGVRNAQSQYENTAPAITGGPFEGCYGAVSSVMNWMTVWDQLHGIPYAPVSRSWIDNYMVRMGFDRTARGPLTGLWDSFFHAMLHSVNDRWLAESNIRAVLDDHALMEEGYPTNYMVSTFMSGDRSQPPLGSLAAWRLYRRFGDRRLLEWVYPRLKRWRQWWWRKRDGNRDGVLEWGSNIETAKPGNDAGTLYAAKCESGMDNSPLYDDADFDISLGTMNLSDVGLNSLFAADAMYLSKIAAALGNETDQRLLEDEYRSLADKINTTLWNEPAQAYLDRFWNGEFSSRLGPTMFYPLLACIPSGERAETLVREHLLNEREFWGEFVVPTISRDDPAFRDQLYWRGRIWPSVNYLVYLGLKACECDEVAHQLALRSVRLFMREWKIRGHCHENYNAITGEGDDVPVASSPGSNGSDRFYPWGALLALMGVEELFDVEMDKGVRFGCRFLDEETRISRIPFMGSVYSISTCSEKTIAWRDQRQFFSSVPGTNIRNYAGTDDTLEFRVSGAGRTVFAISEFDSLSEVAIYYDGKEVVRARADEQGTVSFDMEVSDTYSPVRMMGRLLKGLR